MAISLTYIPSILSRIELKGIKNWHLSGLFSRVIAER